MTQAEWRRCTEPGTIPFVLEMFAGDRKRRLFAAGCCRLMWDALPCEDCRRAVELGERFADGLATGAELDTARRALNEQIAPQRGRRARLAQAAARLLLPRFSHRAAAWVAAMVRTRPGDLERQAHLLRDLFERPSYRVRIPPPHREVVIELAQAVYEQRAFDRLPALADVLEAAGHADAEVLAHCREGGTHVRGCWAVDAILERY